MLGLLLTTVLIAATPSPAASPTPVPDPCGSLLTIVTRPTVTTSTCTVRYGHALLESGYTNTTTTGPGGGVTVTYPEMLARIGVMRGVEFAIIPPSAARTSVGGPATDGWQDAGLGAKWEIGYTSKAVWGLNVAVTAPTGSTPFTAGSPQYTGNANWGYVFNSEFSASGTFSFNSFVGTNSAGQLQRYSAFIPSAEFTAAIGPASQAFGEFAYFSETGPGLGEKSLIDFGYQLDITPHLQFDIEYGWQLNTIGGQRQHYVGAGLSFMN